MPDMVLQKLATMDNVTQVAALLGWDNTKCVLKRQ
jgi:hypothetical protein